MSRAIEQGYDEIPYDSYPFDYTRPENLKAIGALFGLNPPSLERARILELGCSDGGNLLRFAANYPESYTLGVDLSGVEIKKGQENIKKLGLKNLELKHMSITDLDKSYGKFDYIICHGVFSWVPDFVKEGIFRVNKELLSENGVAFISYNTLPGWNMVGTVRELMMYHSSNFLDVNQKITQSRAALDFLNETLEGQKTPHAEFMKSAAQIIADKEDHYLRHEYLAEENTAYYFNDFVKMAAAHSLQYLGDTDLHRMYIGNLPTKAAEKLGVINDIVKTEQYIDFIKNTQFRCTLLCHDNVAVKRNITSELIDKFYFTSIIAPEKAEKDIDFYDNMPLTFYINNTEDTKISVSSPGLKACFFSLCENPGNPLRTDEIIDIALGKLKKGENKNLIKKEFLDNALRLVFAGYVRIISDKPKSIYKISDKPKISDLAMMQINMIHKNGRLWFTNQLNQLIALDQPQHIVALMLDGKNTVESIILKIFTALKTGEINASRDNQKIEDEKELRQIASEMVHQSLSIFKNNYGLVT